jgi:hypothetical protein
VQSPDVSASRASAPDRSVHRTSQVLRSLAEVEGGDVTIGHAISAMGVRAHGVAMVLLALPDAIPLPFPSLSAVLGLPLVIVSAHLLIFGEGAGLPARVRAAKMPRRLLTALARYGAPFLEMLEYLTRPRLQVFLRSERVIAAVCLYLSLLLLLPIPFVNFPPALCLLVIALGMVQRDGALVAAGLVLTAALTYSLQFVGALITRLVEFNAALLPAVAFQPAFG